MDARDSSADIPAESHQELAQVWSEAERAMNRLIQQAKSTTRDELIASVHSELEAVRSRMREVPERINQALAPLATAISQLEGEVAALSDSVPVPVPSPAPVAAPPPVPEATVSVDPSFVHPVQAEPGTELSPDFAVGAGPEASGSSEVTPAESPAAATEASFPPPPPLGGQAAADAFIAGPAKNGKPQAPAGAPEDSWGLNEPSKSDDDWIGPRTGRPRRGDSPA